MGAALMNMKDLDVNMARTETKSTSGNMRTIISEAATRQEKIAAIRDIGYFAIGLGLLVAGLSSFINVESWLVTSSPIVATFVGGLWAAVKAT